MGWRASLRSYFFFNKREKRGVITLLILLVVLLLVRLSMPIWLSEENALVTPLDEKELIALRAKLISAEEGAYPNEKPNQGAHPEERAFQLDTFNPNTASKERLEALGLPTWLAERTIKYREKVKRFTSPEELMKVYGMDTAWFHQAKPFIRTPVPPEEDLDTEQADQYSSSELKEAKVQNGGRKRPTLQPLSLNTADTSALMKIPGIGPFYARSIVTLREQLGGYLSYEQLMSIYRIREETLDALAAYTFIDTSEVTGLEINRAEVKELGMHPYLTWTQARAIVNYRKQHGNYTLKSEILKTDVIPDSVYRKIAPYLKVE